MRKKIAVMFFVLAVSSLLVAQRLPSTAPDPKPGPWIGQDKAINAPETQTCSFSYSSGSGDTFTRYCLTVNGNIVQLDSPSGFEYLQVGTFGEGYGLCDLTAGNVSYFDYAGFGDSANWGATTVTVPNATSRKFVRTTTDGIWQLTQTIKQVKANAAGPGSIQISSVIKNLTGINRDIIFLRYADVDAGGSTSDEISQTKNSAFGSDTVQNGLLLTTNTYTFGHYAAEWTIPGGADPCNFNTNRAAAPFVGDGSIGHLFALTVPKLATKTIKVTYKPF